MRRPWGMYTDRSTKRGRTLLRAGNAIDSIGAGPAELFGTRIGPRFMRARQRIYTRSGGRIGVATDGRLQFKFAHLDRYWWKFYNAARFELWLMAAALGRCWLAPQANSVSSAAAAARSAASLPRRPQHRHSRGRSSRELCSDHAFSSRWRRAR